MANLRLALRTLFEPRSSPLSPSSLALGIGANAAIFSLFDQMLLRPLPVTAPDQLVNLANPGPKPGSQTCNNQGGCDEVFSYAMFRDLREGAAGRFAGLAAHRTFGANLAYRGQTINGNGMMVSGSYFPAARHSAGPRAAVHARGRPDHWRHFVVVLSEAYWRTRFDSNPAVLNDTLIVNGQAFDHRRRRPAGFHRHESRLTAACFRAADDARRDAAGFVAKANGFENRRTYFAYLVRPSQTGRLASSRPPPASTCPITASSTTSKPRCSRA